MKRLLTLLACFLLAGCYVAPSLNLEYKYGSCVEGWGSISIKVDGKGNAHVMLIAKEKTIEKDIKLDIEQMKTITNVIERQNLRALENEYKNEFVTGGMCYLMLVEYQNDRHQINISNVPVPEVQRIGKALTNALTEAEPGWDKII